MDRSVDPQRLLTVHHQVTAEVARLMEGFYSNLEDGLFELAYRREESDYHAYCFDLMRELRFRRQSLMSTFTRTMSDSAQDWFDDSAPLRHATDELDRELDHLAFHLAAKCSAHFSALLSKLAGRAAAATSKPVDAANMPISPFQIARFFMYSCRRINFDKDAIEVVQELFLRFVLDRLGAVYGTCNQMLASGGYESASVQAKAV